MNKTSRDLISHLVWVPLCLITVSYSVDANPGRPLAAREALDAMLNEEYSRSHAIFDSLIQAEPDRPEGYLGKAMVFWDETLILADETKYDREIGELITQSIEKVEREVDAKGDTSEMLFWLGNAYGLRCSVAMMRGNVFEGIVDGIAGREYLDEAYKRDPENVDARFGIGLSDYIIARKPRLMRAVSRLFSLPSGDAEGGIRHLEEVARSGIYCQKHAVSSRAFIDLYYERNYEEARRRFEELHRQYPNSLDYRLRYLDAIFALTAKGSTTYHSALVDSARAVRTTSLQRGLDLNPWIRTKLDFIEGFGKYYTQDFEGCRNLMEKYLKEREKNSWLTGPAELLLGKLADLRGERDLALQYYRQARKREDVWGVKAESQRYLNQPFDGAEPSKRPVDKVRRYPQRP